MKLIERDAERARRVSERLDGTIVLNGDAQDEELLIEENIDGTDVFAAVTNSEEANVLSAMLAKRLGARKVLALINRPTYGELMENRSIDIAVSPQTVTIGSLLAHVRKGDVVRVHSLRRGSAEALETVVHGPQEKSRVVGRRIEELDLPNGAFIVALVRIKSRGSTGVRGIRLAEGDHVVSMSIIRHFERHARGTRGLPQAAPPDGRDHRGRHRTTRKKPFPPASLAPNATPRCRRPRT